MTNQTPGQVPTLTDADPAIPALPTWHALFHSGKLGFTAAQMNTRWLDGYAAGRASRVLGEAKWISVEDRLPPLGREGNGSDSVLVFAQPGQHADYASAYMVANTVWASAKSHAGVHFSHWMPLPEAPGTPPQAETLAVAEGAIERLRTLAHNVDEMCHLALRIPNMPWPDPGAHSAEAYHRAVHRSFCDLRFKLMDIRKEANAAMIQAAPTPTASIAPKAEGEAKKWIEWNGGEMPVADWQIVEYRLRQGGLSFFNSAGGLWWHHDGKGDDIVAYRLPPQGITKCAAPVAQAAAPELSTASIEDQFTYGVAVAAAVPGTVQWCAKCGEGVVPGMCRRKDVLVAPAVVGAIERSHDAALHAIAYWPCPEQDDMQAANMRKVALSALTPRPEATAVAPVAGGKP